MIENTLKEYGNQAVVLLVTHQWDTLLRLKVPTLLFLNSSAELLLLRKPTTVYWKR